MKSYTKKGRRVKSKTIYSHQSLSASLGANVERKRGGLQHETWPRNMPVRSALLQRFYDLEAMSVPVSPAIRTQSRSLHFLFICTRRDVWNVAVAPRYITFQLCSLPAYLQAASV